MSNKAIKKQLLAQRDEYDRRIQAIDSDLHHKLEPVEKDFAEQVSQRENDDILKSLDDNARQALTQLGRALMRIDDGSYGICTACGKPISPERLRALPYADLCIHCATEPA